jgi:D-amino peptidase
MKVYILTDLEGVSGVYDFDRQCWPHSPEYPQAQELLTAEVNAAVQGAVEAGAETVVVSDAHYRGCNLLFAQLHPAAELIHGTMRPHWLPWIEDGWDAFAQIGAHAMAGTPQAILCHSMELDIVQITLNGRTIGEIGMAAAAAGSRGIPTVLVSGDRAAVAEMQALVPAAEGAVVKHGLSRHLSRSQSPAQARETIRSGMVRALGRLAEIPPLRLPPPYHLRVTYVAPQAVYQRKKTAVTSRAVNETTIEYESDDLLELFSLYE